MKLLKHIWDSNLLQTITIDKKKEFSTYCSPSYNKSDVAGSFFVGPLSSEFLAVKLQIEQINYSQIAVLSPIIQY